MAADARIRISLVDGTLEVEGDPEFIAKYDQDIKQMLVRLKEQQPAPQQRTSDGGRSLGTGGGGGGGENREFGEVLHGLANSATGADRVLVGGWFAQSASTDKSFTTAEANQLLIGQAIKLSNAAQAMRGNADAKRVFKVAGNRWRVSKTGEDHLKSLGVL